MTADRTRWIVSSGWGIALCILSLPASAHTPPAGGAGDWASGLSHPFSGLDHLLAMLTIGIWAAQREGRSSLVPPIGFVIGGAAGLVAGAVFDAPVTAPALLATSVWMLGACTALAARAGSGFAASIALAAGCLHGHAHTAGLVACASPATFAAGFVVATALLHATGFTLFGWIPAKWRMPSTRVAGFAMGAAGAMLLAAVVPGGIR